MQEFFEAELDEALGYAKCGNSKNKGNNSRNGYSKKAIKTELSSIEINIPRDRNGEFEHKIIPKHQRTAGNYEKISMVFSILKQYLLEVLNDYAQKEKEIEKYIESEYARMRGN